MLFRLKREGRESGIVETDPRRNGGSGTKDAVGTSEDTDAWVTDKSSGDVRKGREIPGGGDTGAERDKGGDVFFQQVRHPLDEFPTNTGVTSNERVDTDEDGSANPGFRHSCGGHGIAGGEDDWCRSGWGVRDGGWENTNMLVLKKSSTKSESVVRPCIC
jgi:hypothetical protein